MAPRKKRPAKNTPITARTRSGVKYQPQMQGLRKTVTKKSLEMKKTKEDIPILKPNQPMLTRSHKKFGKFRILAGNSDTDSVSSLKESSGTSESVSETENEVHTVEEILLPESETFIENEDDNDMLGTDEESREDVIVLETDSSNDVLDSKNVDQPKENPVNIEIEEDSVMECSNVQDPEAVITQQLSSLDVNSQIVLDSNPSDAVDDNCVEQIEYIPEPEKESAIYDLDNFESEVIIDCISDEVIPISGEQEVVNDTENSSDTIECDKELSNIEIKCNKNDDLDTEKFEESVSPQGVEKTELEEITEDICSLELKKNEEPIIDKENSNRESAEKILSNVPLNNDLEQDNEAEHNDSNDIYETEQNLDNLNKEVEKARGKPKVPKKKSDKTEKDVSKANEPTESSVRRSNRIKSISVLKQKSSRGHGLVKHKSESLIKNLEIDTVDVNSMSSVDSKIGQTNISGNSNIASQVDQKPVKVKSRWRRSSELELSNIAPVNSNKSISQTVETSQTNVNSTGTTEEKNVKSSEEVSKRLKQFVHLKENQYLTERISCKEAKKMVCDCFLTEEDIEQGEYGCGEDCLNRLLMIECGGFCAVGERCTNKRFQKGQFAPSEVFQTEKKGLGIRAAANIPYGEFILEYVGEVLDPEEFEKRATEYSKDKNQHYYFMSLRADAVIDATRKGNISRFINHSCDPNAETQKWTVNGELRIGFFSKRTILAGEEITFDYQFQRYGKEAQKCFCEASTCRGWLGEEPEDDEDEDDDEEEEEEEEDEDEEGEEIESHKIDIKIIKEITSSDSTPLPYLPESAESPSKPGEPQKTEVVKVEKIIKKEKKRIVRQRLPRKDIFEDLDLDDEIDTLQTTGLKNQAHTLKLSRLMVRAKEPAQRTKLLRVLRRGEFPCRRLFLDYHGLRLIHGWMTDAQHMSRINKKLESLRLEILQTLATLPIPNKTMLQDSKVLPTVQKWSIKLEEGMSTLDSDSNSPKIENETPSKDVAFRNIEMRKDNSNIKLESEQNRGLVAESDKPRAISASIKYFEQAGTSLQEDMDISPIAFDDKDSMMEAKNMSLNQSNLSINDYETEIIALALKLLEEWSVLKEVFRIPKKERIEQMKEHEREADRKYKAGLGLDGQDVFLEKNNQNRYRLSRRQKKKRKKSTRKESLESFVDKYERRKLFALHVEQQEMDRRRNQREIWRQHEQRCVVMGADPRFTAPFEPNQEFQCVWNPQTGQWQNCPLPRNPNSSFSSQSLPPPQPHIQSGSQFIGGGHIPSVSSNQPINHPPSSMLPHNPHQTQSGGSQMMKHVPLSPAHLPPSHNMHSKPPMVFNPQPPPPQQPPNSVTQQFNRPPALNMTPNLNLLPKMNPGAPTYGGPPIQHIHQQRGIQQNVAFPPPIPDHIPHQQPPQPTYHLPPEPQNPPPTQSLMHSGVPPLPSSVHIKPPPPLPALPYQENLKEQDDILQVKFMGPIPPPVKLPPKWKCAKDKYGRPYYYHIRIRKSQWEPPELPPEENEEVSDSSSSSESSSGSSESSSEETDSDDDIDDAKLLLQLKNKFKHMDTPKSDEKAILEPEEIDMDTSVYDADAVEEEPKEKSLDDRLIEEFCFMKGDAHHSKKRRTGLVQEILISPRTEEDRLQFKEDMKRYKQNKEKLKRQKELLLEQSKKHVTVKPSKPPPVKTTKTSKKHKISVKTKLKEMTDSETAKKIKESFRSSMAVVMVSILNAYRKPECKEGRITNTEDFKHLARKLTHFVMLKELKHCQNIEDLTCTESVKSKAKEFVRKYMSKFGEVYQKPKDETEFY